MSKDAQDKLSDAMESGPIERIEIEFLPNAFRWKLWAGGRMTYSATGKAVASELAAMIEATDTIARTVLGVSADVR